ncbi:MAG: metal-dependent hydrolase [Myxococcota bacterium]
MSASAPQSPKYDDKLTVRRIPFEFPADLDPHWHPHEIEWGHMVNGASLSMPYLEPYLIKSVREGLTAIDDEDLKQVANTYCAQEGQHYRQHRRFNDLLIESGYPGLREVEEQIKQSFDRLLNTKSLEWRLGYAAGFESMALAVGHWLVNNRERLFGGSDTRVASLILWHFVEELEHKNAALDVYQYLVDKYFLRVYMIWYATFHVIKYTRRAYIVMLEKDGLWNKLRSRLRLYGNVARFFAQVLPHMVRCSLPGHSPRRIEDPPWVKDWVAAYQHDEDTVPLLDTANLGRALHGAGQLEAAAPPAHPPATA